MKQLNWMGSFYLPTLPRPNVLVRAIDLVLDNVARSRERRQLGRLDDRLLADIGLSRSQAWAEQRKRFWEK